MTDHVSRTKATIARCVAARQWAHIAAIEGISEHSVRVLHDPTYKTTFGVTAGAVEVSTDDKAPLSATKMRMIPPVQREPHVTVRTTFHKSAPREWVARFHERRLKLGMVMTDVAEMMGTSLPTLRNAMSLSGHMSDLMRDKIELILTTAERMRAA